MKSLIPDPHSPFTADERSFVREQAKRGASERDLASIIRNGIPLSEFRRWFGSDYAAGKSPLNIDIAEVIVNAAKDGDTGAAKFYLTHQAGWIKAADALSAFVASETNLPASQETPKERLARLIDITPNPATPSDSPAASPPPLSRTLSAKDFL